MLNKKKVNYANSKKKIICSIFNATIFIPSSAFLFFSKNRQVIKSDMGGGAKTLYIIWFMINLTGMFFIID